MRREGLQTVCLATAAVSLYFPRTGSQVTVPLRLQLLDEGSAKSSNKIRIKELEQITNKSRENLFENTS